MTVMAAAPRLFDEPPPDDVPDDAALAPTKVTHFADIVFDRPLDQTYTYGIPDDLAPLLRAGMRVEAPFGRGDKIDVGYCVNTHRNEPSRPAKQIVRILDREILIPERLLKLTRWVADYYLCGWGQALQAILPAAVRE